MQRQRNPLIVSDPSLQCFECGHQYDHLGGSPHPGVCRECGQRAVSFAGVIEVSETHVGEALGQDDMLEVHLKDATDRVFTYYLTVDHDDEVATLYVARIEDTRLTPQSPYWSSALVPDALRELVEDPDGLDLTLHVPDTGSSRGSDSDRGLLR